MDADLRARARAARGFMPDDEGDALYDAAASLDVAGPLLEVGSYCGKSGIYIGAAARAQGRILYALDHHRGSEENQSGWEHHEPDLVDPEVGRMDTLPVFRRTIHDAGLEGTVVAVVGDSPLVAASWDTEARLLVHRWRPWRGAGPPRLRRLGAQAQDRRHPGNPRRVPGPCRRWASAVRDLSPCRFIGRLRRDWCHRLPANLASHRARHLTYASMAP